MCKGYLLGLLYSNKEYQFEGQGECYTYVSNTIVSMGVHLHKLI